MKNLLMAMTLVLATSTAFATPPDNRPPENRPPGHDRGGEATVEVDVGAAAFSNSSSNSEAIALSNAVANGGDGSASVGDVSVDINDDSAASAAAVITSVCQNGGSAQTRGGGFSVVGSDPLCDYWKAAHMAREAHLIADRHGDVEVAEYYNNIYHSNMIKAQELIDKTEHTATAQRFSDHLFKPLGLLALLIFVI